MQGSWLAAKHGGPHVLDEFKGFEPQMRAQLEYWMRERKDNATGLYVDVARSVKSVGVVAVRGTAITHLTLHKM